MKEVARCTVVDNFDASTGNGRRTTNGRLGRPVENSISHRELCGLLPKVNLAFASSSRILMRCFKATMDCRFRSRQARVAGSEVVPLKAVAGRGVIVVDKELWETIVGLRFKMWTLLAFIRCTSNRLKLSPRYGTSSAVMGVLTTIRLMVVFRGS